MSLLVLQNVCASREEDLLYHDLFGNYTSWIRPVKNYSQSVVVVVELFVSQLVKVVRICSLIHVVGAIYV